MQDRADLILPAASLARLKSDGAESAELDVLLGGREKTVGASQGL